MFKILEQSSKSRARTGVIKTPHGPIETPAFIPVATRAAVKGATVEQLQKIGVPALLSNTYHLYLRPGEKLIKKMGNLHQFMGWRGPLITDSGGFQAFSLGLALEHNTSKFFPSLVGLPARPKRKKSLVKIAEEGIEFCSHLDGSRHLLTPEKSIQIQRDLGADIIFVLDECTSPLSPFHYIQRALDRTHRWAERCWRAFAKREKHCPQQFLFGIVQGGWFRDLREESARIIASMPFAGFGIGGSLGKTRGDMLKILDWTIPLLPPAKPRHLLGVGDLWSIKAAVRRGTDMFDCVLPTRLARNGVVLTERGRINLLNSRWKNSKKYGYWHHLFKTREMLGPMLATVHNLQFMENYMRKLRRQIKNGDL